MANNNGIVPIDEDDSLFFKSALEISIIIDKKLNIFRRIHTILMKNDNIKFLNDQRNYTRYL